MAELLSLTKVSLAIAQKLKVSYLIIMIKKFISITLCFQFIFVPVMADEFTPKRKKIKLDELVLPSEVTGLGKQSGAVFYTDTVKNKVLIPVHFWGSIGRSGLYFIPTDTTLIEGISLAGGPNVSADIENVILQREVNNKVVKKEFDLSDGGDNESYYVKLQPGDTVFMPKDTFKEDRSFYISLLGVVITALSGILIYRQVQEL